MTASELILKRLSGDSDLALFEFKIMGCSESAISARLREMARTGKVIGHYRKGENFKRWNLNVPQTVVKVCVIDNSSLDLQVEENGQMRFE